MNIKETLKKYYFQESTIDAVVQEGITDFYPPQAEAIKKGILEKKSLLMAVPTASGKTLMAELCMLKSILEENGRCLYIAPLKALAGEKYDDFKKKYSPLGIKVGIAIGDLDSPSRLLNRYQVLIATAEKVDSLLRSRARWLLNGLSVVVLDEIHFINDGARGPTMEILTARIKQFNPNVQILALSATVKNADEMAAWLNAKAIVSQWRPVPLKEGVYFNERIVFDKDGSRIIKEEPHDDLSKLVIDTLRGEGQVLVFVGSRRSAQAASRIVSRNVLKTLTPSERKELGTISKKVLGTRSETTKICRKLSEVVACGAAFHHAGLRPQQRKIIEDSFKSNLIKVICSTPTLAAGVNLPARRAIIRDCKRYEAGLGSAYIPAFEYKQCAGRAGRPKYDKYGEAILIAKSPSESRVLFDRYIHADPEPVISKLGQESALRMHVLSSIASGYVHDINSTFDFISHTFLAHQHRTDHLIELIGNIFDYLCTEGLIDKSGFRYFATAFGQCISRLYVDPVSGIRLRDGLKKIEQGKSLSSVRFLNLICTAPDMELTRSINQKDYEELEAFASSNYEDLILTPDNLPSMENFYEYMTILKTTWLLLRWVEEEKEDILCDEFSVGPGDIHRHVEAARWLLHATAVLADLFHYKNLTFALEDLHNRVRYGVREELLELVSLKNIGRIRARILFSKGFKKLSDLKYADEERLAAMPGIGKTLAKDILTQIAKKRPRKSLTG